MWPWAQMWLSLLGFLPDLSFPNQAKPGPQGIHGLHEQVATMRAWTEWPTGMPWPLPSHQDHLKVTWTDWTMVLPNWADGVPWAVKGGSQGSTVLGFPGSIRNSQPLSTGDAIGHAKLVQEITSLPGLNDGLKGLKGTARAMGSWGSAGPWVRADSRVAIPRHSCFKQQRSISCLGRYGDWGHDLSLPSQDPWWCLNWQHPHQSQHCHGQARCPETKLHLPPKTEALLPQSPAAVAWQILKTWAINGSVHWVTLLLQVQMQDRSTVLC